MSLLQFRERSLEKQNFLNLSLMHETHLDVTFLIMTYYSIKTGIKINMFEIIAEFQRARVQMNYVIDYVHR